MKNLFLLLCLGCIALTAFTQKEITVKETKTNIAGGSNNALSVIIYEADENDVLKAWKKKMKDYKAKVSDKKEIFADDAQIKDISENTVDVYSKTEKDKDGNTILYVAFDLGGAFLSSSEHSDKYKKAEKLIREFGVKTATEAVEEQVSDAEKVLKGMQDDLDKLVKENESLNKKIEEWEQDIQKAKDSIGENEKSQEDKNKEIEEQQKVVNAIIEKQKQIK